jgi:outer membrane murein-binding lipoprotein Lpp
MLIRRPPRRAVISLLAASIMALAAAPARAADTVVVGNQIVQGKQCVGVDCVNGESFGTDTVRLKENTTRLGFMDTSSTAGFPSNDWALFANEPQNGGLNMFAIQDTTAGTFPFIVEAGAPSNSLRIDPAGDLGLGVANPQMDFQIQRTDTPAIRLEQSGGGFVSQTWDVAGNEANFFVRDVTNGTRLPFRIRPGAPTSSIDIASNGNVGIGTANATAPIQVRRSDGTAQIAVQDTGGAGDQTLLDLRGNTSAFERFAGAAGSPWLAGANQAGNFTLASGSTPKTRLTLEPGGDLSATGSLDELAGAADRENVSAANSGQLLDALRSLQLSRFEFPDDPDNRLHLGPTGADFAAAFGLGGGDSVGVADLASVALGAAQALDTRLSSVDSRVSSVDSRVTSIESQLADTSTSAGLLARIDQLQQQVNAANALAAGADQRAATADKRARKALKKIKKLKG